MDSVRVIKNIEQHVHLTQEEKEYLESVLLPMKVSQNEFIEEAGKVTRYFIHVNEGCLMTYYTDNQAHDHVMQFATPGWWTGDLKSFTTSTAATYSTKALSDSGIWLLPKVQMDELTLRFPKFERFFRILFQNSLIAHQERIVRNLSMTADERYHYFTKKYPSLEQFVPQKYIASYLGITPEFLSKIRRKMSGK